MWYDGGNGKDELRDGGWSMMGAAVDFGVLVLLYALVFYRRWRARGREVLLVNTLMYVYLAFVLYFTLMPIITSLPFVLDHVYRPMNLEPFIDVMANRRDAMWQIILNVVMTVPFGFLLPLVKRGKVGFWMTTLYTFLLSLGIEVVQPLIDVTRSSDVTDLITNVAGGMIGYGGYLVLRPVALRVLEHVGDSQKIGDRAPKRE